MTKYINKIKSNQDLNLRYTAAKDMPAEGTLDQKELIILSPSESQIITTLSDNTYPLGVVGSRKPFHPSSRADGLHFIYPSHHGARWNRSKSIDISNKSSVIKDVQSRLWGTSQQGINLTDLQLSAWEDSRRQSIAPDLSSPAPLTKAEQKAKRRLANSKKRLIAVPDTDEPITIHQEDLPQIMKPAVEEAVSFLRTVKEGNLKSRRHKHRNQGSKESFVPSNYSEAQPTLTMASTPSEDSKKKRAYSLSGFATTKVRKGGKPKMLEVVTQVQKKQHKGKGKFDTTPIGSSTHLATQLATENAKGESAFKRMVTEAMVPDAFWSSMRWDDEINDETLMHNKDDRKTSLKSNISYDEQISGHVKTVASEKLISKSQSDTAIQERLLQAAEKLGEDHSQDHSVKRQKLVKKVSSISVKSANSLEKSSRSATDFKTLFKKDESFTKMEQTHLIKAFVKRRDEIVGRKHKEEKTIDFHHDVHQEIRHITSNQFETSSEEKIDKSSIMTKTDRDIAMKHKKKLPKIERAVVLAFQEHMRRHRTSIQKEKARKASVLEEVASSIKTSSPPSVKSRKVSLAKDKATTRRSSIVEKDWRKLSIVQPREIQSAMERKEELHVPEVKLAKSEDLQTVDSTMDLMFRSYQSHLEPSSVTLDADVKVEPENQAKTQSPVTSSMSIVSLTLSSSSSSSDKGEMEPEMQAMVQRLKQEIEIQKKRAQAVVDRGQDSAVSPPTKAVDYQVSPKGSETIVLRDKHSIQSFESQLSEHSVARYQVSDSMETISFHSLESTDERHKTSKAQRVESKESIQKSESIKSVSSKGEQERLEQFERISSKESLPRSDSFKALSTKEREKSVHIDRIGSKESLLKSASFQALSTKEHDKSVLTDRIGSKESLPKSASFQALSTKEHDKSALIDRISSKESLPRSGSFQAFSAKEHEKPVQIDRIDSKESLPKSGVFKPLGTKVARPKSGMYSPIGTSDRRELQGQAMKIDSKGELRSSDSAHRIPTRELHDLEGDTVDTLKSKVHKQVKGTLVGTEVLERKRISDVLMHSLKKKHSGEVAYRPHMLAPLSFEEAAERTSIDNASVSRLSFSSPLSLKAKLIDEKHPEANASKIAFDLFGHYGPFTEPEISQIHLKLDESNVLPDRITTESMPMPMKPESLLDLKCSIPDVDTICEETSLPLSHSFGIGEEIHFSMKAKCKPKKVQNLVIETAPYHFTELHNLDLHDPSDKWDNRDAWMHNLAVELARMNVINRLLQNPCRRYRKNNPAPPVMKQKTYSFNSFEGWDMDRPLGIHLMNRLPHDGDKAKSLLKMIMDKKERHENLMAHTKYPKPNKNPREEGAAYASRYGLDELFEFMLCSLLTKQPENALDYLIEMTREIKREMKIRYESAKYSMIAKTMNFRDSASSSGSSSTSSSSSSTFQTSSGSSSPSASPYSTHESEEESSSSSSYTSSSSSSTSSPGSTKKSNAVSTEVEKSSN